MIYSRDVQLTCDVCELASDFLEQRANTHFRSRLNEGRTEESCEWSLAMAMSKMQLHVYPWLQGYNSPQLDFIEGLTEYDAEFERVRCRYYTDRFVYMLRGLTHEALRDRLIKWASLLPGKGDFLEVIPLYFISVGSTINNRFGIFLPVPGNASLRPNLFPNPIHCPLCKQTKCFSVISGLSKDQESLIENLRFNYA